MNSQNSGELHITLIKTVFLIISGISRVDEFGFRVEEEDGPEQISNKLLSTPFIEDPQQRFYS